MSYLKKKESEIKGEADRWAKKTDEERTKLEDEIENLTKEKTEKLAELEELRTRKQKETLAQKEREEQELRERQNKQEEELNTIRRDNAIKLI